MSVWRSTQADIRVGDQAPVPVDYIGMAALADPDLRDDVPDELKIDLGHADARIATVARERQRNIGLRLAAEIDRSVIDLVRHRIDELGLARNIQSTADDVHGNA